MIFKHIHKGKVIFNETISFDNFYDLALHKVAAVVDTCVEYVMILGLARAYRR